MVRYIAVHSFHLKYLHIQNEAWRYSSEWFGSYSPLLLMRIEGEEGEKEQKESEENKGESEGKSLEEK